MKLVVGGKTEGGLEIVEIVHAKRKHRWFVIATQDGPYSKGFVIEGVKKDGTPVKRTPEQLWSRVCDTQTEARLEIQRWDAS